MEIELHVEVSVERLRRFTDELQAALGEAAQVRAWFGTADPEDQPKVGTVFVDVADAEDQEAALIRVQPAVWKVDPSYEVVKGGTLTRRDIIPQPPRRPASN
jgi:hypothetical protein